MPSDKLTDTKYVNDLLDWADIIYEGGGDTMTMIKLWRDTGFDKMLEKAYDAGKVMCGLSAGANCWFKLCSTDSLKILYGEDKLLVSMECLGFIDGLFVPHCDEKDRMESVKEILRNIPGTVGIAMSNCAAIEIVDNQYRIICGDANHRNITPYGLKVYWNNEKYTEQKLEPSNGWHLLNGLYDTLS